MIPILYESSETDFQYNGLCRLGDCVSCVITEERNGIFECDFEYPVSGRNFEKIIPGCIVLAECNKSGDVQPFDIVSYSKPINGVVSFHAVHISYRQTMLVASGTNISSLSAALTMLGNSQPANPFTYETDKTSTGVMAAADGIPRTVKTLIGGVEGSILDAYGGELLWDKFKVKLLAARGVERYFTIRYGLNMMDYKEDTDYSEAYSAAVPFWKGSEEGVEGDVIVKGSMVDSGLQTYNGRTQCVPLDLSDKFESKPTAAQLEAMAASYMTSNKANLPTQSIEVSFVDLRDTLEYKDIAPLLDFSLCDTVRVEFPMYGMSGQFKIVKTVYNVLAERYDGMELGALSTTLSQALGIKK